MHQARRPAASAPPATRQAPQAACLACRPPAATSGASGDGCSYGRGVGASERAGPRSGMIWQRMALHRQQKVALPRPVLPRPDSPLDVVQTQPRHPHFPPDVAWLQRLRQACIVSVLQAWGATAARQSIPAQRHTLALRAPPSLVHASTNCGSRGQQGQQPLVTGPHAAHGVQRTATRSRGAAQHCEYLTFSCSSGVQLIRPISVTPPPPPSPPASALAPS